MTKQQAEALAIRLARIWDVPRESCKVSQFAGKGYFDLRGQIELEGEVATIEFRNWRGTRFHLFNRRGDNAIRYSNTEITYEVMNRAHKPTPFITKWMSLFRRNCWLSNLTLECTHAEVIQWMQIFPLDTAYVLDRQFLKGQRWSAHEKLELRLSLPREFWPQKWLDEEAD